MADSRPLLLLAPSVGFGGGIERLAHAVEQAWPAPVTRVDLYRSDHTAVASGQVAAKIGFTLRALSEGTRARPRVVLALHVGLLPVAHAVARVTRATTALMGIGIEVWGPMRWSRRRAVQRCGSVVAVSRFTAHQLAGQAGLDESAIAVVSPPVSQRLAEAARGGPGGRPTAPEQFITVSRLSSDNRYKGHFAIAGALARVLERQPSARWLVVGGGDDVAALRAACVEFDVASSVDFLGAVDDARLLDAYARSAFLVLPSSAAVESTPPRGEGFGIVYLEAGALGLPSIASEAGGGSLDFVEHGVTGLTVPEDDLDALADAIIELISDQRLRERLGRSARARVLARHLPEHFSEALQAALRTRS